MKAIYFRVSTDHQDFLQQRQTVYSYLQKVGITGTLPEVVEKKSGAIRHTERKLSELLSECKNGDTIYISELSRLSRTMTDLFNIITEAGDKGVTIVQCKDGTIIENNSIGGKALLFALSLAAEIELNNIRQRTIAGLNARKAAGQEIGGTNNLWGSRNGNTDRAEATKRAAAVSSGRISTWLNSSPVARSQVSSTCSVPLCGIMYAPQMCPAFPASGSSPKPGIALTSKAQKPR